MAQGYQVALRPRLMNVNGTAPAAGWLLYTKVAGSDTNLATYSDAELTSLNTNPIVVDADGYYRIYVAKGVDIKVLVHNASDVLQYTDDHLEPMIDPTGDEPEVPTDATGVVKMWSGAEADIPDGYLLCDGSAVSRATYDDLDTLYASASYPYGNGDGATTFNVPDLRGRFPLGVAASGTGDDLGETGGTIDHVHTGPSHTHGVTVSRDWTATGSANSPSVEGRLNTGKAAGTGQFSSSYQPTADLSVTSAAGGTGNTGTANPPFIAMHFIVKT